MKKKILSIITLIAVLGIGLLVLTGCGNNEQDSANSETENKNISTNKISSSEKEITVNNIKLKLDKETTFGKDFKYKYSSSFELDSLGTTSFYSLQDSDKNKIVEIRVNNTLTPPEQVLTEKNENYYNDNTTDVKSEDKMINNIQWYYIEYNNTNSRNKKDYTNHEYYYKYNKYYCVIQFIIDRSIDDISELEQEFISNVSFN